MVRIVKHVATIVFFLFLAFSVFAQDASYGLALSKAAVERTKHRVLYTGGYIKLDYPEGDVPDNTGVCTDVVIRSYRNAHDVDLQVYVHEDMKANFSKYPQLWQLRGTDRNIDHRRTQNLECLLTRKGAKVPITDDPKDYLPGDLVFWGDIATGHVGVVTHLKTDNGVPLTVHNIGAGPKLENFLFASRVTGHYRWQPK
jgi:uncharacterized protein YijF (DUF1287 family)